MKILISLVGEQPAPNVLPFGHYEPDKMILVHTELTKELASRIACIINGRKSASIIEPYCKTDPFLISEIQNELLAYLYEHIKPEDQLIFNLTGGTKTMEFAALDIAMNLEARAFYFQTGVKESLIHPYFFENRHLVCEKVISSVTTMTLDEYLQLYLGSYNVKGCNKNSHFEENVIDVLKGLGEDYEVFAGVYPVTTPNVEFDWVLRYRHSIAIGEVKENAGKDAVEQVNIIGQRELGTYIKKFIIHTNKLDKNNEQLMDAYGIIHIRLPDGKMMKNLTEEDKETLRSGIRNVMEPRKNTDVVD